MNADEELKFQVSLKKDPNLKLEFENIKSNQGEQEAKTKRAVVSVGGESVKVFGTVAKVFAGVAVGVVAAMNLPIFGAAAGLLAFL